MNIFLLFYFLKESLTRHQYRCIESFTCKDCGQIFKYKYTLKLHNNNCLGNKNNNHLDRKNIEENSPSHTENPNQEISHLSTFFEEKDPPPYPTAFNQSFPSCAYSHIQEEGICEKRGNTFFDPPVEEYDLKISIELETFLNEIAQAERVNLLNRQA